MSSMNHISEDRIRLISGGMFGVGLGLVPNVTFQLFLRVLNLFVFKVIFIDLFILASGNDHDLFGDFTAIAQLNNRMINTMLIRFKSLLFTYLSLLLTYL